jgi:hypothetical protein
MATLSDPGDPHRRQRPRLSARARLGPLPVTTQDRYQDGRADSRIRLLGVLPIMSKRGPDADRAMRSRLLVESVWLPSTFLPNTGAAWSEHNDRLRLTLPVHGEAVQASLRIGSAGELHDPRLERWSDLTDDHAYTLIPFQSRIQAVPPGGRGPTVNSSSSARRSSRPPSRPNIQHLGPAQAAPSVEASASWPMTSGAPVHRPGQAPIQNIAALTLAHHLHDVRVAQRSGARSPRLGFLGGRVLEG